jgi:energy-coupling factor transporter transmembrane protein EcfT
MILIWLLGLVFLAPPEGLLPICGLCLMLAAAIFRGSFRRLLRWRWLLFLCFLIVPSTLWIGEADQTLFGVLVSLEGLKVGFLMALRAVVMLIAMIGFSGSVDISEVAGLLEGVGLHGLGFSMGVAMNLLPSLVQSCHHTWNSIRMRGGFRRQRWRVMQLLLVTVVANALRRAEEITMAAEVRAFSPDRKRGLPIKRGMLDGAVAIATFGSWILLIVAF